MRIVFIGTVLFSKFSLVKLIEIGANVVGVITRDRSSFNADFDDLLPVCEINNIPYKCVNDVNHPNNINWIKNKEPDVIYCFGWSSLIKEDLLNVTPLGVIGFHPAALPNNRGRHPLIWALALGLKQTASTFFKMDKGADTGDIISQECVEILETDDALSLYNKIVAVALIQITSFTKELQDGTLKAIKQPKEGNSWRKRGIADGKIDFRMNSLTIYNLVRALTRPYVGAHIELNNEIVKIWKAKPINWEENNIEPGKILKVESNFLTIKTADGAIELLDHTFSVLPEEGTYL
jgi:methionyl-tRNA formyltransferase